MSTETIEKTQSKGVAKSIPTSQSGVATNARSTDVQNRDQNGEDQLRNALRPPVDVFEDATGITLYADMPGVAKDKVKLEIEGDQLLIEGEMSINIPDDMSASHAEVQLSRFRRTFALSKELDAENIEAECQHGVLRLRIPKAKHAQPRRIEISVG